MVITMSTQSEKRSPQYQMRLHEDFRQQLEEVAKQDGDTTLATWIKRVLRKELQSRGIEPKG
jgi:Leu/Phe-tRNA-protein transferase